MRRGAEASGGPVSRGARASGERARRLAAALSAGAALSFPWRRPRYELALLALVAFVALSPIDRIGAQDYSRICVARAMLQGRLSNDVCLGYSVDRSLRGGHLYTDKAPGVSALEAPAAAAVRLGPASTWRNPDLRLWGVRVLSTGIAFLLCAFLVGRVAEGLAPGWGSAVLVAFALGTLVAPLAATAFSHDVSAALGFAAFLLAWRRRPGAAGLLAGLGIVVDYEGALLAAALAAYVALQGRRPLARYLAATLPGLALLGAYDWAAFGAPWHLSYNYLDNMFSQEQGSGAFGIGVPSVFGFVQVFAGGEGLLVTSPVLVLAAIGLVRLARRRPAEAALCGVVTVAYVLADVGYFLPYGGASPGPRFLVPALPFLALGLAPAFAAWPLPTSLAAAASIIPTTALTISWAQSPPLPATIWNRLVHVPTELAHSPFLANLSPNVLRVVGAGPITAAGVVFACAGAAFGLALAAAPWGSRRAAHRAPRPARTPRRLVAWALLGYLLAAADVLAVEAYPYGDRVAATGLADLSTGVAASTGAARVGDKVNYVVTANNAWWGELAQLLVTITLPAGGRLVGAHVVGGSGACTAVRPVSCVIGAVPSGGTATVRLGVTMTERGAQTLTAVASTGGVPGRNVAASTVVVSE